MTMLADSPVPEEHLNEPEPTPGRLLTIPLDEAEWQRIGQGESITLFTEGVEITLRKANPPS